MIRPLACVAALLLAGCAQNAVLEMEIELPPAPNDGQEWFALVQAASADGRGFESAWSYDGQINAVPLTDSAQRDCISVQSTSDTIDLNVRVRFCGSPECNSIGDDSGLERRYRLEHPFYIGRRTFWETSIGVFPQCTTDDDCEIGRCIEGQCGCATDADCCDDASGCTATCEGAEGTGRVCVENVARCRIEGCVTGGRPASFCSEDGRHFCEGSSYDRTTESYMCSLEE